MPSFGGDILYGFSLYGSLKNCVCLFLFQCSATCGSGVKQRSVECSDKDFSCEARTKPQTTAPCNLEPCPQWTTGSWGEVNKNNQCLTSIVCAKVHEGSQTDRFEIHFLYFLVLSFLWGRYQTAKHYLQIKKWPEKSRL